MTGKHGNHWRPPLKADRETAAIHDLTIVLSEIRKSADTWAAEAMEAAAIGGDHHDCYEAGHCHEAQKWADYIQSIFGARLAALRRGEATPPDHVCGLQGYNGMVDPPCPGCEANRKRRGEATQEPEK